jgi:4a-hydroxytetrahydrobiopterin dehydratase
MATSAPTQDELAKRKCVPCEGGVPPLSNEQAKSLLDRVEGWSLTADGKAIRRSWVMKNFMAGIHFFDSVATLAEEEGHHPDLHLQGYRNVAIELSTHAIGGLSENDFILAAKINLIPVQVRR